MKQKCTTKAPKKSTPALDGDRPRLARTVFETSRSLEFFSRKELIAQTGHDPEDWPAVALKELLDNALDACEEAGVAPEISVSIDGAGITVQDNGPGIPASTIDGILDFSVRISSREAYVSPTRGAQGNALKTLVAMPFVLGESGRFTVEARGATHDIQMRVDRIRQQPVANHQCKASTVKKGTRFTLHWPESASTPLADATDDFYRLVESFVFFNPHASIRLKIFGTTIDRRATCREWTKWRPSDPTSAHWYTDGHLSRLIAAYLSHDSASPKVRTVRDLVSEFHGLSGTAKRKKVLEESGLSRAGLGDLVKGDNLDAAAIGRLLASMKTHSRPIKPAALGVIGREHVLASMLALGCAEETFDYRRVVGEEDGAPFVLETAFAAFDCALDSTLPPRRRRLITGINFSATIGNPFRDMGYGSSLDALLSDRECGPDEPVCNFVHLASPRVEYMDRGKTAISMDRAVQQEGHDE